MVKIQINAVPNLKVNVTLKTKIDLKPMIILDVINTNSIQLKKLNVNVTLKTKMT